jgi:hypothetical protein
MGSQQSQPTPISDAAEPSSTSSSPSSPSKQQTATNTKRTNETGYDLATRKCARPKRLYDACYTAALTNKEEDCGELFDNFRMCFLKWMRKDMERRGVSVSSGSMIGEFIEEEEDT